MDFNTLGGVSVFLELIATFAAGFGGAGLALALNMLSGGRLPRWSMPVAAGLAMLAVAVASEYTWGSRTASGLPEGVSVVEEYTQTSAWKPWTYVVPQTMRMVALDRQSARRNADHPDIQLVDLYLLERWQPPAKLAQFVDCGSGTRADATDRNLADLSAARWHPAPGKLLADLCNG